MNRIRPGRDLWFTLAESNKYSIRSLSLRFDRPGDYEVFLRLVHDKATGTPFFEFDAVSDGADCSGEVVRDSPLGRPPVKPELQAKGRELLGQIAEANRYWLGLPPEEVRDYRYTFTAPGSGQGRGTKKYEVRDDSGKSFPANEMEATHAKRHGITYYSALHFITAQPEDVVFRQVEIDGDEIRLAYSFKGRMWLAASRCLFASRNGFFVSSRDIHEGVVVLDRHTLAPREHTNSGFSETFSDYVRILPDHYAPREIRFGGSGYRLEYDYQFEFNVYHPGLWLFHTCRELDFDPRTKVVTTKVIASINGVEVNGKPAELMPAGN
jgi:hypothetical protein